MHFPLDNPFFICYNKFVDKQIVKLKARKKLIQQRILQCAKTMIRGSLTKIARRCHNKDCPCYQKGSKLHGFMYAISSQGEKATEMFYLSKDAARSPQLSSSLAAFKQFWKLSKQLAQINLILYKADFLNKRR